MTSILQKCLPAFTFFERTGSGSVSWSGFMRIETAEDAVISLRRLLTPWVDSFNNEVTFCVDSFNRSDTEGVHLLCPFKSLLSMLIAKRMEFRPTDKRREKCKTKTPLHTKVTKIEPWYIWMLTGKTFFSKIFLPLSVHEFFLLHISFTLSNILLKLFHVLNLSLRIQFTLLFEYVICSWTGLFSLLTVNNAAILHCSFKIYWILYSTNKNLLILSCIGKHVDNESQKMYVHSNNAPLLRANSRKIKLNVARSY